MHTDNNDDENNIEYLADETDYNLSYNIHPIARCLDEDKLGNYIPTEENS